MPSSRPKGLHTLYVSPLKALAVDVQRNLIGPIEEMGLPIRVETRTGDTPSDRKARQRVKPPQVLLTTPESLSLLLSYPDRREMFEGLRTIVVDELHGFAKEKRGDLLSLSMSRLQKLAPGLRRVGLSATISDPDAYRSWLAPDADMELVDLVIGDPGAEPDLSILIPENKIPWGGHSGYHAIADVMRLIEQHKTTLVFSNTRGLAELIFQKLWDENEQALPIGIHHGSLSVEARRKVEAAMAAGKLRGLVATASLDLGIDWGDVDLVVQMGAPKGSSRLLQRIGRANHRLDEPSKGIIVPGNRFEYLEARAALDAIDDGELDPEVFRPGALDVLAQHILAMAVAAPFQQDELLAEIRSAAPYAGLKHETFEEILNFIATGGYALKAYDRFRRLVPEPGGMWRIARPADRPAAPHECRRHRRAAVAHRSLPQRPEARHGRGRLRLGARAGRPLLLRWAQPRGRAVQGHRHHRPRVVASAAQDRHLRRPAHVDVDAPRQPRPPHARATATTGTAFPTTSANGSRYSRSARCCPSRTSCSSRPSRTRAIITWSPTASRAGTRTSRSECCSPSAWRSAGLKPLGFVANDYGARLLRSGADHATPNRYSPPTSSSRSSSTGSKAHTCSRPRSARWR